MVCIVKMNVLIPILATRYLVIVLNNSFSFFRTEVLGKIVFYNLLK